MGVRIRSAGFFERIFGPGLAVLYRPPDKTRAFAEAPGNFPKAGSCVRAACLRHPDREALKNHRAHEPKWMKDGLTTLS